MLRRTLMRLHGGGVLHPDATRNGRKPGQIAPHTIGQMNSEEKFYLISAMFCLLLPATIVYGRWWALNQSSWVDEHYDPGSPYEKEWARKHMTPYKHLRPMN
eukprot:TRINITY_DN3042_c1_g1_i1.p2 TRINITY_DN3042_c1_g1~~TRINITY_DN3042_c1_g1_i1.p2  ORF type:complete len:102 (+),score=3.84 TRINITY_DN3042_c1_g1_i1:61-366(+)